MQTAKIFINGSSQAVRLPKPFRFNQSTVCINKVGHSVILFSKEDSWINFTESLSMFSDDFLEDRHQPENQKRVAL